MKSSLDARWTSIVKHCECVSVETLMPTCLLPLAFLMQVRCFKSRFLAVGQISRQAMIFFASPIFKIIFPFAKSVDMLNFIIGSEIEREIPNS